MKYSKLKKEVPNLMEKILKNKKQKKYSNSILDKKVVFEMREIIEKNNLSLEETKNFWNVIYSMYLDKKRGIQFRRNIVRDKTTQKIYVIDNELNKNFNSLPKIFFDNITKFPLKMKKISDIKKTIKKSSTKNNILEKNFNYLLNFIENEKSEKTFLNIYIHYENFSSKNFYLKLLASRLQKKNQAMSHAYINVSDLQNFCANNILESKKITNILKKIDYLYFENLGEEIISDYFRDNVVFDVLNKRFRDKKRTFISSKYAKNKLLEIETGPKNSPYQKTQAEKLINLIFETSKVIKFSY